MSTEVSPEPETSKAPDGPQPAPPTAAPELPAPRSFPIVGIGASAGGLEAFRQLLGALPGDTGMAFVLIQHLDPRHESHLTELLAASTAMPVIEATQGMVVAPDHVYVTPANADLSLAHGRLRLVPRDEARGPHLPINCFFRSLAESPQVPIIGVVLSGTGSDGTLGLGEMKAVGGITFAQDEGSAKHSGMPRSAVASGYVDFVLPPEEIARRLGEINKHPYMASAPPAKDGKDAGADADADASYRKILDIVRTTLGVDFSLYRDTTIRRRINRRMALRAQQSLASYGRELAENRKEVVALYHDLLVNVTCFFRDPEVFEALKQSVFPQILKGKTSTTPIRIWVPGCSTGQEAYSLAIVLLEVYGDGPIRPPIQIFATDLSDKVSLEKARAGIYPATIEAEVSPERLRRFFRREDHGYRIDKSIRDICVFARQNVTADPPFSHVDLISCRNMLIYLAAPLQRRVLPTFHYALNVPGFLLLGSAETVGESADLFEPVDRTNKIYAKKVAAARPALRFAADDFRRDAAEAGPRSGRAAPSTSDFQREADRILLGRYAPPAVLVNDSFEVLQFRGRTSPYLEMPAGDPTTNLLRMAREGLFVELRNALTEARAQNQPVRRDGVRLRGEGQGRVVDVKVVPVRPAAGGQTCFLVLFEEASPAEARGPVSRPPPAEPAPRPDVAGDTERELVELQRELAATKEYLQSLVELQDAANEELRSANEEVLSANEELQSTNEELETAKEELQSANEELTTVNEQLDHRNGELTQVNDDLTNLIASTQIPFIMVGGDLRIRRITAAAKKALGLLPADVGRLIGDIKPPAQLPDLEGMIGEVMENMQPRASEVKDRSGRWYELRVHPYRTADQKIDGAVVVLFDIDERRRIREALHEADRRKDEFLATLAHELRNPLAPIRNAVEILKRAGDDRELIAKARDLVDRQVHQISRIIEDLIDVSRIVHEKIELRKERVALGSIVDAAVETCHPLLDERRHELTIDLPAEPIYLDADPARLSQVVINLLHNAVKFTEPKGHIWLTAERASRPEPGPEGSPEGRAELILRVRDNGIGMKADLIPKMFDMFIQGHAQAKGVRSGLGIGLVLARRLVQMHGGTLEAESPGPGRGSTFTLRMPLAEEAAPEPATSSTPAAPSAMKPRRVLVVDDNQELADSLGELLELLGHEVRVVLDGASALKMAEVFAPEVMIVDIGLPDMSGHEVARRIRAQPRFSGMRLVAQTGWGQKKDREISREAGFDRHLVKPVALETLEELFQELPEAASTEPPGVDKTPTSGTIVR